MEYCSQRVILFFLPSMTLIGLEFQLIGNPQLAVLPFLVAVPLVKNPINSQQFPDHPLKRSIVP